MGAWGYDIFENDDACDIRECFNQSIRKGLSVADATNACVEWWPDCMRDMNALLAIAALQMEKKALQSEIRTKCLKLIENDTEVFTWNDPERRKRILESFRQKLLHQP